jgi:hypothetical protein
MTETSSVRSLRLKKRVLQVHHTVPILRMMGVEVWSGEPGQAISMHYTLIDFLTRAW